MPFVLALDGLSGAGKSTIAATLGARLAAAVVPTDDFFAARIPAAQWDAWPPPERATPKFLREWHARWDDAEDHCFSVAAPPVWFELMVTTA